MEKTKLGISVRLLCAAVFFSCLFGGYVISVILVGYILLFEENGWLRQSAIRGIALLFAFSILSAFIQLIPNTLAVFNNLLELFDDYMYLEFVQNIVNLASSILSVIKTIMFLILGLKALKQQTVNIPVIDPLAYAEMWQQQ